MKYLLIASIFFLAGSLALANECKPKSCDQKLVEAQREIKRLKSQIKSLQQKESVTITKEVVVEKVLREEAPKNIISGYVINSKTRFDSTNSTSMVEVTSEYELGLGLMYQRSIKKNVYLGIAGDTNRSVSLNIGLGF